MRKQSKAVKERIENYNRLQAKFKQQGYQSEKITISIVVANVVAILIGVVLGSAMLAFYVMIHSSLWKQGTISITFQIESMLLFFLCYFLLIIVHEALHGCIWGLYCKKKFQSIQFGILWKYLTPYCCCKEVLPYNAYVLGGLMPFLILGVVCYIIAILLGRFDILLLSILNVIGASGDLIIAFYLIRQHEGYMLDLPQECGYMRFYKE